MTRKKRQISMAEAAAVEKRTFIQPLDMSKILIMEELAKVHDDCITLGINPEMAWDLFRATNLGETVFDGDKN